METTTPTMIAVAGRFDVHRVGELRAVARHASALVVDLSRAEFLDEHALDALEELAASRPLALAAPSLVVRVTLEMTGRRLAHYPDVATAVSHVAPPALAAA